MRASSRQSPASISAVASSAVERIAKSDISVLVLGETGVGKEILTRRLHQLSSRAARPLLVLNCAALTESLIESELFGHEKGAFTGATATKPGLLESAESGTVFLDEIGEMPLPTQSKLLRVIEQQEILRVGAVRSRKIDVRFMPRRTATWKRTSIEAPSAATCSFGWQERSSECRRCASAHPRSSVSRESSWRTRPRSEIRYRSCRPPRCAGSNVNPGRATCASCEIQSNARPCSATEASSNPSTSARDLSPTNGVAERTPPRANVFSCSTH